jgi:uncharacterized protein
MAFILEFSPHQKVRLWQRAARGEGLGAFHSSQFPPESEMLITVRDLELRPLHFDQEFQPGTLDFGSELVQRTPLHAKGEAELVEEVEGQRRVADIRLRGHLATKAETLCARCAEPVEYDVNSDFDLLYRPVNADTHPDEASISQAETEIGFYQGDGIQLEDVLKEQVLLSLPAKMLCREDCKGLCPQCGKNWNQNDCRCEVKHADPRWAALESIKGKLKK